jgi:hypothetical protein
MWPHLTMPEFLIFMALLALRGLPDWLHKFVRLADELERRRDRKASRSRPPT